MPIEPGFTSSKPAAANTWATLLDNPTANPPVTMGLQKCVFTSLESADLKVDFAIVDTGESKTSPPDKARVVNGQELRAGEFWDCEALRSCFVPSGGALLWRSTRTGLAASISWIGQS